MNHLYKYTKPQPILEKTIENAAVSYAKARGVFTGKITSMYNRGLPDRLFIYNGNVIFVEYKQKDFKPTKLQAAMLEKMEEVGANVYVNDNIEDAVNLIKKLIKGAL